MGSGSCHYDTVSGDAGRGSAVTSAHRAGSHHLSLAQESELLHKVSPSTVRTGHLIVSFCLLTRVLFRVV